MNTQGSDGMSSAVWRGQSPRMSASCAIYCFERHSLVMAGFKESCKRHHFRKSQTPANVASRRCGSERTSFLPFKVILTKMNFELAPSSETKSPSEQKRPSKQSRMTLTVRSCHVSQSLQAVGKGHHVLLHQNL